MCTLLAAIDKLTLQQLANPGSSPSILLGDLSTRAQRNVCRILTKRDCSAIIIVSTISTNCSWIANNNNNKIYQRLLKPYPIKPRITPQNLFHTSPHNNQTTSMYVSQLDPINWVFFLLHGCIVAPCRCIRTQRRMPLIRNHPLISISNCTCKYANGRTHRKMRICSLVPSL